MNTPISAAPVYKIQGLTPTSGVGWNAAVTATGVSIAIHQEWLASIDPSLHEKAIDGLVDSVRRALKRQLGVGR